MDRIHTLGFKYIESNLFCFQTYKNEIVTEAERSCIDVYTAFCIGMVLLWLSKLKFSQKNN